MSFTAFRVGEALYLGPPQGPALPTAPLRWTAAPPFHAGLAGKPRADSTLVPSCGQGPHPAASVAAGDEQGGCAHWQRPGSGRRRRSMPLLRRAAHAWRTPLLGAGVEALALTTSSAAGPVTDCCSGLAAPRAPCQGLCFLARDVPAEASVQPQLASRPTVAHSPGLPLSRQLNGLCPLTLLRTDVWVPTCPALLGTWAGRRAPGCSAGSVSGPSPSGVGAQAVGEQWASGHLSRGQEGARAWGVL